jgi:hypothetical protein
MCVDLYNTNVYVKWKNNWILVISPNIMKLPEIYIRNILNDKRNLVISVLIDKNDVSIDLFTSYTYFIQMNWN